MSRCFPYTPRLCVRKAVTGEAALIESIKLQNTTERRKTSRREKKKDETRSKLSSGHGDDMIKKPIDQEEDEEQRNAGSKRKHSERGNEQVERSDLTVERGRPFSSQNTAFYMSHSLQSSDKRRRDNGLADHGDDPQKRGIIRIRLNPGNQSQQKKDTANQRPDNSQGEQRGETETISGPTQSENRSTVCSSSNNEPKINVPCLAVDNHVSISSRDTNTPSNNALHGLEIMYSSLTDNWTRIPHHPKAEEGSANDLDWLFGSVQQENPRKNRSVNRQKSTMDNRRCQSSSLWPQAQYLPEVRLYALPYTIPF